MVVVFAVPVGILLLAGVVYVILHPLRSLRRLVRFTVALFAVVLILGGLPMLFLAPKVSLWDWVWPTLVLVVGGALVSLYNWIGPPSARLER